MNEKGQEAFEVVLLMGGGILVAVIVISILTATSSTQDTDEEHNAKFFCESHGLELIDFEDDFGKLEEVKCFKENENLKVFKKKVE